MKRILKKVKLQYLYECNTKTNSGLCVSAAHCLTRNEYKLFEDYIYAHLLKGNEGYYKYVYAFEIDNVIDRIKWLNKHLKINK